MDVGIHFVDFLRGDTAGMAASLAATARAAEEIGATMFTMQDHFSKWNNSGRLMIRSWSATPRWGSWQDRPSDSHWGHWSPA